MVKNKLLRTMLFLQFSLFLSHRNIQVDILKTHDSVSITWNPPPSNQVHGTLLSYKITAKSLKVANVDRVVETIHNVFNVHGSLTSATISDLEAFNSYSIIVQAVNEFGDGVPGDVNAGNRFFVFK